MTVIQTREQFTPRAPTVTLSVALGLVAVFAVEHHPHLGLPAHDVVILAFSSWTRSQLVGELVLLGIGGTAAEQFLAHWKVSAYLAIVGPATVWFAEFTHPNTIVTGLSGATTGLIAFGILAAAWWYFERPESLLLEIASSALVAYGADVGSTAVYGVLTRIGISTAATPFLVYHPGTMYDAHVAGFIVGFTYWAFEHYAVGTA